MWKYFNDSYWSIIKTSGFLTLTFDLWRPFKEGNVYRLSINETRGLVSKEFTAKDFEDAKLQANELIYDALRWNR